MLRSRFKSFGYAMVGIKTAFLEEPNFRIHGIVGMVVLAMGFYCKINKYEWLIILMTIGMVLVSELLNTAIENLCDHITQERSPSIKKVKDVSAAAVLITAIIAVVVGVLIFYPYVKEIAN